MALQSAFWPVYLAAVGAATLRFAVSRQWCLGRAAFALVLGSLAQFAWEGGGVMQPWQQLAIDVPIFVLITMPPRHYWQATLGALVFAQVFLHAVWWLVPELAREHWLGTVLLGFGKCAVLLLWSGGARVEHVLGYVSRLSARMVLATPARKLAR